MKNLVSGKVTLVTLFAAVVASAFLLGNSLSSVSATQVMVTICHATGSEENPYTEITAAYPAIYGQAGHFSEPGTPNSGHEDDYEGPCEGATATPVSTGTPEATATPEVTATPEGSSTPEPSATPLVCTGSQHLDAAGKNCVDFQLGGPSTGGTSTGGQVLGASTMASAGSFAETLYQAIIGLGATLSLKGFKKVFKKK